MNEEYISIQEAWEAAGGNPEIKASKEELVTVLKLLDQCVDEQDEDIKKLEKDLRETENELHRMKAYFSN